MPCQTRNNVGETANGGSNMPTTIIQTKRDLGNSLDSRRQEPSRRNDKGEAIQCTMEVNGHKQIGIGHRWLGGKRRKRA